MNFGFAFSRVFRFRLAPGARPLICGVRAAHAHCSSCSRAAGATRQCVCWVCTVSGSSGTPFCTRCAERKKANPARNLCIFYFFSRWLRLWCVTAAAPMCRVFGVRAVTRAPTGCVEPPARPARPRARPQQLFHQPNPSAPAQICCSPYHSGLSKRSSFSTLSSHELCQPVLKARARLCRASLEQQK